MQIKEHINKEKDISNRKDFIQLDNQIQKAKQDVF